MSTMPKDALAGAAVVVAILAAFLGFARIEGPANAATVTVTLPKARPATLLDETSGAGALAMRAIGGQAQVINAALPYSDGPLQLARPFVFTGNEADERLALTCLTQAVYYEAGYEPVEGQRAVAQVVLNRVRHPAFPKSVCGVVYQGAGSGACQFTFVCNGALSRVPAPDVWRESQAVAVAALSGYVEPSVGEATHYHADYVTPAWAPLLAKVNAIGQHIFYRWPGAWGQAAAFTGRYAGEPRDPMTLRLAESTYKLVNGRSAKPIVPPRLTYHVKGLLNTLVASAPDAADAPAVDQPSEAVQSSVASTAAAVITAGNS
jgi:spore germination cell wall hydrolase CwlJ-like protein